MLRTIQEQFPVNNQRRSYSQTFARAVVDFICNRSSKKYWARCSTPYTGWTKKISIDMPGMPSINDLMFSTLMQALLEDLPISITVKTPQGSAQDHEVIPRHLRIRHDGWQLQLQTGGEFKDEVQQR